MKVSNPIAEIVAAKLGSRSEKERFDGVAGNYAHPADRGNEPLPLRLSCRG
jgi:hypothetical protein